MIKDHTELTLSQATKIIIAQEFESQRCRDRGVHTIPVGDALTVIEMEIKEKLLILVEASRLTREMIYEIYPHLRPDESKEAEAEKV